MADISPAEFEVLNELWQQSPLTANALVDRLSQHKDWHEKTVKTLISRLLKKRAISFEKQGRTYFYSPVVKREDFTQSVSTNVIERFFSGKISPLVAGFAKSNKLKADDVAQLKSIIDDWEKEQGSK